MIEQPTPTVSIIVIAYNEEARISSCLDALLAQDADIPYEVIVVDDCSRDSTAHIVAEYQHRHAHLTLLRHTVNKGRGAARRTGQDAAHTAHVGFVDADIVVPPDWLRRSVQELSDVDGVSGIALPDGDCAVIWRIFEPTLRVRPGSAEITGNNVIFSRRALSLVPFSPEARLGEDFRLAKLMTRAGLRLRTIADLRVEHREAKTYWQGVSWMWQSGVDATSLLFEFRVLRLADIAWLSWLLGVLALALACATGHLGILWLVAGVAALTAAVAGAFIYSRFALRPHPARFLGATLISPPMMLAYLAGRTVGLLRVPLLLRRPPQRITPDP